MEEEVLVFPSALLRELGEFHGFSSRVKHYLPAILQSGQLSFQPRSIVENEPAFKQLIPYVVLRHKTTVYSYERGSDGGEARLHQRLSIGIGGHITRFDGAEGKAAYEAGFLRELTEEVEIRCHYRDDVVGLVNDDRTPVGQVHFGIVHLLDLDRAEVEPKDKALANARFIPIVQAKRMHERYETWSQFVLDNVFVMK